MDATTEGQIPCLHALALALYERSRILGCQAEHIIDNALGPRPHREDPVQPGTIYDLLALTLCALNYVGEEYESLARHVEASEEVLKNDACMSEEPRGPQPGELVKVPYR